MPRSSSRSRGTKPQNPDSSHYPPSGTGASSSSIVGSMESTPSGLGLQSILAPSSPSEKSVARRSLRIAAVAANKESPLPGAMHASSPSSFVSPPSEASLEVGFQATSALPYPLTRVQRRNDGMSTGTGGAVGKRKGKSECAGSENKRRRGRPPKGIRLGGNEGDESEQEEEASASRGSRGRDKRKGKGIVDEESLGRAERSVKARKLLTYKNKGKLIDNADSEPVKVSNKDHEEHREMVQKALNLLGESMSSKLHIEPPEEAEDFHHALVLMGEREKLLALAPQYAYFNSERGEETMEDDELLPDGPGPFSKAMKKIQERATVRSSHVYEADDSQASSQTGFSEGNNTTCVEILWTPSTKAKELSPVRKATPLQELTTMAFLKNADVIESFKGIPFAIRNQLCFMLCKTWKMNMRHLAKMMEGNLVDLRLSDCSWASEKNFEDAFGNCDKSKLEVLQLDRCGGCMPDYVLCSTLASESNSLRSLTKLSLKGAYSISDQGLYAIVSSAPQLNSLNLCQCSLLTTEGIINVINKLALVLKELYIDDCHNISAMSILPSLKKVKCLEVLSMAGILSVSNEFVHELIPVCGSTIWELNFAYCNKLTSSAIKVIGKNCPHLSVLDIRNLTQLKNSAILYLANECRTIQVLRLRKSSFSDEVIAAFIEASGSNLVELSLNKVTEVGHQTAISISEQCHNLKKLNLSFCRNMSDNALGLVVDSCNSLRILKLFGCTQVTNKFLDNYSNPLVNILGVGANLTENIEIPNFM